MLKYYYCLVLLLSCFSASALELVQWDNKPIKISIEVGKERLIHFPEHVSPGAPSSIYPNKIRLQALQGTLYLKSNEPFNSTRLQVKLLDSKNIVLIDLNSVPQGQLAGNEDIAITLEPSSPSQGKGNDDTQPPRQVTQAQATQQLTDEKALITPKEMFQYVSQLFYWPQRTHRPDSRLSRVHINPNIPLTHLFSHSSYALFDAKAVASWRANNGLFLTAIRVQNTTPIEQTINPKHLDLEFLYFVPQVWRLKQRNIPGDYTMTYVITEQPFEQSLYRHPAAHTVGSSNER